MLTADSDAKILLLYLICGWKIPNHCHIIINSRACSQSWMTEITLNYVGIYLDQHSLKILYDIYVVKKIDTLFSSSSETGIRQKSTFCTKVCPFDSAILPKTFTIEWWTCVSSITFQVY